MRESKEAKTISPIEAAEEMVNMLAENKLDASPIAVERMGLLVEMIRSKFEQGEMDTHERIDVCLMLTQISFRSREIMNQLAKDGARNFNRLISELHG